MVSVQIPALPIPSIFLICKMVLKIVHRLKYWLWELSKLRYGKCLAICKNSVLAKIIIINIWHVKVTPYVLASLYSLQNFTLEDKYILCSRISSNMGVERVGSKLENFNL